MACTLSNIGIQTGCIIQPKHVSQSVDAFSSQDAYNIYLSGSLNVTGSTIFSSSNSSFKIQGINNTNQSHLLSYNCATGDVTYVACSAVITPPAVSPYYTSSFCSILPLEGNNQIEGTVSTIGGGCNNAIKNANYGYIGGGQLNTMSFADHHTVIVGGYSNSTSFPCSFIGGGRYNNANNAHSFIGGGSYNTGSSEFNIIVGGTLNQTSGVRSIIIGGYCNCTTDVDSIVVGGLLNCTTGEKASIVGGAYNTASTDYSFIGGGCCNYVCHNEAFILGSNITSCAVCTTHVNNLNVGCTALLQPRTPIGTGQTGMITTCDKGGGAAGLFFHDGTSYKELCTTGGGGGTFSPYLSGSSVTSSIYPAHVSANNCTTLGAYSTIAGGTLNTGSGVCGFIGGGACNNLQGCLSSIVGGIRNRINSKYSFIGGGAVNIITADTSSIIGGGQNEINSRYSFIGGGYNNTLNSSALISSILTGENNTSNCCNTHIIGSNLTADKANYTYVNNLDVEGTVSASIFSGSFVGDGSGLTNLPTIETSVTVSSAQVLSLNGGGSIELIAAPGANKVIAPVSIVIFLDYNTTAYNFSGGPLISGTSNIPSSFLNSSSDKYWNLLLGGAGLDVDSALNLYTTTQTVTTGDSPLKLNILYRIVDFS